MSDQAAAVQRRETDEAPEFSMNALALYGLAFTLIAVVPSVASWQVSVAQGQAAFGLAVITFHQSQVANYMALNTLCSTNTDVRTCGPIREYQCSRLVDLLYPG